MQTPGGAQNPYDCVPVLSPLSLSVRHIFAARLLLLNLQLQFELPQASTQEAHSLPPVSFCVFQNRSILSLSLSKSKAPFSLAVSRATIPIRRLARFKLKLKRTQCRRPLSFSARSCTSSRQTWRRHRRRTHADTKPRSFWLGFRLS